VVFPAILRRRRPKASSSVLLAAVRTLSLKALVTHVFVVEIPDAADI
jgi:hypothetical protein